MTRWYWVFLGIINCIFLFSKVQAVSLVAMLRGQSFAETLIDFPLDTVQMLASCAWAAYCFTRRRE